jgi:hypothetical protein
MITEPDPTPEALQKSVAGYRRMTVLYALISLLWLGMGISQLVLSRSFSVWFGWGQIALGLAYAVVAASQWSKARDSAGRAETSVAQ